MIKPGSYSGRAVEYKWGKSSKGTHQVAVEFEILGGEFQGQRVPWYGYFTKDTWERTCKQLRLCGWTGTDLHNLGKLENEVQVVVEHNSYENDAGETKTFARVAWVNRSGIYLPDPMSDDELRKFSAGMKQRVKDRIPELPNGSSGASAGDPFAGDQAPPPIDDDIPF